VRAIAFIVADKPNYEDQDEDAVSIDTGLIRRCLLDAVNHELFDQSISLNELQAHLG
jgi:hypothetical protein